jgi:hypothetical protein
MASFTGSKNEFRRYIGPRLRNLVQMFTASYRNQMGQCSHCSATEKLQAAHVRGRDRNQIIDIALEPFWDGQSVSVELHAFEEAFVKLHQPLEQSFLILCNSCHKSYDSPNRERPKSGGLQYPDGVLPIFLTPADPGEFKKILLISKRAEIDIRYADGKEITKKWDASGMSVTSNVIANLRSRPEFRSKQWQLNGIHSIAVRVCSA